MMASLMALLYLSLTFTLFSFIGPERGQPCWRTPLTPYHVCNRWRRFLGPPHPSEWRSSLHTSLIGTFWVVSVQLLLACFGPCGICVKLIMPSACDNAPRWRHGASFVNRSDAMPWHLPQKQKRVDCGRGTQIRYRCRRVGPQTKKSRGRDPRGKQGWSVWCFSGCQVGCFVISYF